MMLPALVAYSARLPAEPAMYQAQPVRYVLRLTPDGRPLPPVVDRATKEDKNGPRLPTPHIKRTVGIKPKLLADNAEYTLGVGRPDSKPARVRQQHAAFTQLVAQCAQETGEPAVITVDRFLQSDQVSALPLPDDFDPAANFTFQVAGVYPFELPAVQRFWARVTGASGDGEAAAEASTGTMRCIVCGQQRPILTRHPLKIKGIPGGQTSGNDLISANSKAFESYGLQNSEIAPTCHTCAEAYGNALNALLADPKTHLRLKHAVYVFWTVVETQIDFFTMFSDPDSQPEQVRSLIDAARTGKSAAIDLDDPAAFYATCLGPSGARVVVRDWIDTTLGGALRSLGEYFALQELVAHDGSPGEPLPIWRLANATLGPGNDPPQQRVTAALFSAALTGAPLPLDLLAQAARRVRAEAGTQPGNASYPVGVRRDRAVLIKMVLNSQPGGMKVTSSLDLENTHPAYLCGRLLAVIDAIQRRALGQTNATVIDKFYGSASSTPAAVFGPLIHNTQNHLGKLRKDPRSHGAAVALERRLTEIMRPLKEFPATLTLPEQGMFALGYYHQRADDERARQERREATEASAVDSADAAGA